MHQAVYLGQLNSQNLKFCSNSQGTDLDTKTNWIVLVREELSFYESNVGHTNTVCGQNVCMYFHVIAFTTHKKLLRFQGLKPKQMNLPLIFVKLVCFRSSAVGGDMNVSDVVKAAGLCATLYSRVSALCMNTNAACNTEYVFTLVGIVCYCSCSVFISLEYADRI